MKQQLLKAEGHKHF